METTVWGLGCRIQGLFQGSGFQGLGLRAEALSLGLGVVEETQRGVRRTKTIKLNPTWSWT